jgi:hypothetical protein
MGDHVLLNRLREFHKARNIHARSRARVRVMDPRATVLVVDPDNGARWIEIRADVDLLEDGAEEGLDRLTRGTRGTSASGVGLPVGAARGGDHAFLRDRNMNIRYQR